MDTSQQIKTKSVNDQDKAKLSNWGATFEKKIQEIQTAGYTASTSEIKTPNSCKTQSNLAANFDGK